MTDDVSKSLLKNSPGVEETDAVDPPPPTSCSPRLVGLIMLFGLIMMLLTVSVMLRGSHVDSQTPPPPIRLRGNGPSAYGSYGSLAQAPTPGTTMWWNALAGFMAFGVLGFCCMLFKDGSKRQRPV